MAHKNPDNAIPSAPAHDYDRQTDFTQFEISYPNSSVRGQDLDAEFNHIERALDETQDRLDLIQRSDGALRNESVHPAALAQDTMDSIGALGASAASAEADRAAALRDETQAIRDSMPPDADLSAVADSANAINLLADDLAGTGWSYDLGLITVAHSVMEGTPDGYLVYVYNNMDAIIDAATGLDGLVPRTGATGSAEIPLGTTAQRDPAPQPGYLRFNTDTSGFEGFDGATWGEIAGGSGGGETGADGASIISAEFVSTSIVFTKDDATTVTLANATNTLRGPAGPTGPA
jgi:hypothetical protein